MDNTSFIVATEENKNSLKQKYGTVFSIVKDYIKQQN